MVKVKFRYKDEYSHGKWCFQSCITQSVEECIKLYGLDEIEYEIIEVEEI